MMDARQNRDFASLYSHGFIRTAVCIPRVRVADPAFNLSEILSLAKRASDLGSAVALFPELCISAYSNEDLFHQDALLNASRHALAQLVPATRDLLPVLLVGVPLQFEGKLFPAPLSFTAVKFSAWFRKHTSRIT